MSGSCDAGGGAQAGFPREGAGRRAGPEVGGSLRPLPAQLPPPAPGSSLMSDKPGWARSVRSAAPRGCSSASAEPRRPLWPRSRPNARKCAERSQPTPEPPAARPEPAAAAAAAPRPAPPPRSPSACGREAGAAAPGDPARGGACTGAVRLANTPLPRAAALLPARTATKNHARRPIPQTLSLAWLRRESWAAGPWGCDAGGLSMAALLARKILVTRCFLCIRLVFFWAPPPRLGKGPDRRLVLDKSKAKSLSICFVPGCLLKIKVVFDVFKPFR
ncbi:translation initiation factor IF-2 [Oryctolagus cuniculus]|uniref:translation initiation factor IF-2 n=1 Tax=Oryctolagus cuniculus TaxID=9986 RepID=UPI0038791D25